VGLWKFVAKAQVPGVFIRCDTVFEEAAHLGEVPGLALPKFRQNEVDVQEFSPNLVNIRDRISYLQATTI